MNKTLIGVAVALLVGAGLGLAASGVFQDTLAVIKSEIVPSTTVSNQTASLSGTITLNVGKLEAGKHYSFDDIYGETYLYTGSGGNFTFSLAYNETAFQYVKVEVEISGDDHGDYYVDTEFYLDTNTPVFVITLPADIKVEIEVELKEITVSPNATLGPQEIHVLIAGP